ncbi:hypothetical protein KUCAC02_013967, partial [Chaenocephalus aceratus]
ELSVRDVGRRNSESSHRRRPVHHLSSCRALLRVAVLHALWATWELTVLSAAVGPPDKPGLPSHLLCVYTGKYEVQ